MTKAGRKSSWACPTEHARDSSSPTHPTLLPLTPLQHITLPCNCAGSASQRAVICLAIFWNWKKSNKLSELECIPITDQKLSNMPQALTSEWKQPSEAFCLLRSDICDQANAEPKSSRLIYVKQSCRLARMSGQLLPSWPEVFPQCTYTDVNVNELLGSDLSHNSQPLPTYKLLPCGEFGTVEMTCTDG